MNGMRTHTRMTAFAIGAVLLVWRLPGPAFAEAAKGEQVYKAKQCSLCHKINGSGGKQGPDLSDVGTKRDAEWLQKYLVNPKSVVPKGTMPAAKVTPDELRDLIDFLETLTGRQ